MHFSGLNNIGNLVNQILGKKNSFRNSEIIPALVYGKKYETRAREIYLETNGIIYKNLKYAAVCLVISDKLPILGASSGGLIDCKFVLPGWIEIKCLYTHKEKNPPKETEKVILKGLNWKTGNPLLKKTLSQMVVTKRTYNCDFILYTQSRIFYERIQFDEELWKCMEEIKTLWNFIG